MKNATPKEDVGIIVGRFHIHELHEGHTQIIESVIENHDKVIIFLGLSPLRNTVKNPLDFRSRREMIRESYPDIDVFYVEDVVDDEIWSKKLDEQIARHTRPNQTVVLYGGRDSFIKSYSGRYKTKELEAKHFVSGTEIRRRVSNSYNPSKDYRAGIIFASMNRFPTAYQTVDIAVLSEDGKSLLLGRKTHEKQWRFLGGFSDPSSDSLEDDARREVAEEAGIEVGDMKYVGSRKIDDWRYKNEIDCVKTAFFVTKHVFGRPEGGDDIAEVRWFELDKLNASDIVSGHDKLFEMLKGYLGQDKDTPSKEK